MVSGPQLAGSLVRDLGGRSQVVLFFLTFFPTLRFPFPQILGCRSRSAWNWTETGGRAGEWMGQNGQLAFLPLLPEPLPPAAPPTERQSCEPFSHDSPPAQHPAVERHLVVRDAAGPVSQCLMRKLPSLTGGSSFGRGAAEAGCCQVTEGAVVGPSSQPGAVTRGRTPLGRCWRQIHRARGPSSGQTASL